MILFLWGIILHTFSISWNDCFNIKTNLLLRFTNQPFKICRFTRLSEHFTSSPFLSSHFTDPLSVVQVLAVFVLKVCVWLVRVCQVQSSPNIFLKEMTSCHSQCPLFPQKKSFAFDCISQSGLEASRCYTIFLRTNFVYKSGIWKIYSQFLMRNKLHSV